MYTPTKNKRFNFNKVAESFREQAASFRKNRQSIQIQIGFFRSLCLFFEQSHLLVGKEIGDRVDKT